MCLHMGLKMWAVGEMNSFGFVRSSHTLSCYLLSQLKVDKMKLIELCGTSECEFSSVRNALSLWALSFVAHQDFFRVRAELIQQKLQVSTSMRDLCYDVFGISREKKDPREVKGNRGNISLLLPIGVSYLLCWTCCIVYPCHLRFFFHSNFLISNQL